jgi:RNA polymerase sigma factor (sigma-70 family)
MEASALTRTSVPGLRGPSALLRLQSDERLIAMTRRGQHAAFETLCSRYQSRLLSFCRHMLGSREDAEDVLQEVFAAAFNAVLADDREINVRPWLYRIARNRSLNHLRRASAVGVDSMDVHFADNGLSTSDRVIRRESFRELLADVQQLPETQHTALLLREIDALSYEQIAQAMETTVPSVKSLLVRARISLAEAAEARKLSCAEVRLELGEVAEGVAKLSVPARRHTRGCDRCRFFKKQLKDNNHALAVMLPVGPLLLLKKLLFAKLGSTASAGGAHMASGAGATMGAGAGAAASAGGSGVAGGIFTAGAGALATKAVAGLAAAAMVTAGAVAAEHAAPAHHHPVPATSTYASVATRADEPIVVAERAQPLSSAPQRSAAARAIAHRARQTQGTAKIASSAVPTGAAVSHLAPAAAVASPVKPDAPKPAAAQVTQVTTETTQLPAVATGEGQPPAATTPPTATVDQPAPPAPAPSSAESAPGSGDTGETGGTSAPAGEPPAGNPGKGSTPPTSVKDSPPASPSASGAASGPAGETALTPAVSAP